MAPLLFLAFIAVPLAELFVILQVGSLIGALPTIALLLVTGLLGAALVRSQGRLAWRRLAEAAQAGRPPAKEVLDGALVLLGGALLLTPGFLTDGVGVALLAPPSRALLRAALARRLLTRMTTAFTVRAGGPAPRSPRGAWQRREPARPHDVEGTVVDEPGTGDPGPRRLGPQA